MMTAVRGTCRHGGGKLLPDCACYRNVLQGALYCCMWRPNCNGIASARFCLSDAISFDLLSYIIAFSICVVTQILQVCSL